MKISSKLVFFFLISAIIPVIVVSSTSFYLAQASLEKQNFIAVNEEADLETDRIKDFFIERKKDIAIISKFELLKQEIGNLNQFYTDPTNLQYIESNKKVDALLGTIRNLNSYDDIIILNTDGKIVFVSKYEEPLFLTKSFLDVDPAAFMEGKNGVYLSHVIPDVDDDRKLEMFLSAPILDDQGNLLGIIVLDIPVQQFLDKLFQQTYVGETNETLVVTKADERIILLNNLRFPINAEITIDEIMKKTQGPAYKAISSFTGAGYSTDYRDQKVIAAWRYIQDLEWGLVSKIDVAEVFEATNQLQQDTFVLSIIILVGVGVFGVVISRTISKPISMLNKMALKIGKGDLNARVIVAGTDEISTLGRIMNDTVEKLGKERKDKENIFKAISVSAVAAITDKEGTITYANKKFEETSKYSKEELIGANHRILNSGYHPDSFWRDMYDTLSKGKVWYGVVKNKAKDGSCYWVNTIITPFLGKDGKPEQYIAIRMNITKQKELEQQLKDTLEHVKKIGKEKEEFSAMITHELKTPLTTIIGYSDMLNKLKMGNLNEEQKFAINEIFSSSISLEKLIEDILTARRLELSAITFNKEKTSTTELLKFIHSRLLPMMDEKQIEFLTSIKEDFDIIIDKERILEVFTNLVQNSVDFVPDSGGRIEITCRSENSNVLFSIIDNGLGIPKEKLGKLFTKYYQIDTSIIRKHGGSGLGLAICRGFVEGLGGKIWIESEKGKGTIVYFTIPKA